MSRKFTAELDQVYRHVKTGGLYRTVAICMIVRSRDEFEDGRFQLETDRPT